VLRYVFNDEIARHLSSIRRISPINAIKATLLARMESSDDSMLIDLFDRLNDEGRRLMTAELFAGAFSHVPFVQLLEQASLPQKAAASKAGLRALDVQHGRKRSPQLT